MIVLTWNCPEKSSSVDYKNIFLGAGRDRSRDKKNMIATYVLDTKGIVEWPDTLYLKGHCDILQWKSSLWRSMTAAMKMLFWEMRAWSTFYIAYWLSFVVDSSLSDRISPWCQGKFPNYLVAFCCPSERSEGDFLTANFSTLKKV